MEVQEVLNEDGEQQSPEKMPVIKVEQGPAEGDVSEEWNAHPCLVGDPSADLTPEQALELLKDHEGRICLINAALPKAGHAYLYDTNIIGESWENDHYEWVDAGVEHIPKESPVLSRVTHYVLTNTCLRGSTAFQRIIYSTISQPNIKLVFYMGDEKTYKEVSHTKMPVKKKRKSSKFVMPGRGANDPLLPVDMEELERARSMDVREATEMLENYEGCVSRSVAQFPKGGEIYYYDSNEMGESWKLDGYTWRNAGKRSIPKENPELEKFYYTVRLNENTYDGCLAFQRIVFRLTNRPHVLLVQYTGDEAVWQIARSTLPKLDSKPAMEFSEEELANPPAPVFKTDPSYEVTWEEAANFLKEHKGQTCNRRPFKPKAGEAYMFHLKAKMKEAWKNDGYTWQGLSPIYHPRERPKFCKKIFHIKTDQAPKAGKRFQKTVFHALSHTSIIFVHYSGDDSLGANLGVKRKADEEAGNSAVKMKFEPEAVEEEEEESAIKHRALRLQEVIDILTNHEGNISQSRAIRPKAGEIYLFDTTLLGDDWKCDNYVWRNSGTNFQPKKNPMIKKIFYSIRLDEKVPGGSKAFQKTSYSLLQQPNIIMVHYFGDESVYSPLMHGNRKRGFIEYTRTCPSVMKSIKKALVDTAGATPKTTLKHLEVAYRLDDQPRNLDQIRNTKRLLAKKKSIPGSSRRNLKHEMTSQSDVLQYVQAYAAASVANFQNTIIKADPDQMTSVQGITIESVEEDTADDQDIVIETEEFSDSQEISNPEPATEEPSPEEQVTYNDSKEVYIEQKPMSDDEQKPREFGVIMHSESVPSSIHVEEQSSQVKDIMDVKPSPILIEQPLKVHQETQETVLADQKSVDITKLAEAGGDALNTEVFSKLEKAQPIIIQALDPRPEVCKVQIDLLNQQRRNLELQEKKLLLEIKQLEENKPLKSDSTSTKDNIHSQGVIFREYTEEEQENQDNIIYLQDPSEIDGIDDGQIEQIIYIDGPAEGFNMEGMFPGVSIEEQQ